MQNLAKAPWASGHGWTAGMRRGGLLSARLPGAIVEVQFPCLQATVWRSGQSTVSSLMLLPLETGLLWSSLATRLCRDVAMDGPAALCCTAPGWTSAAREPPRWARGVGTGTAVPHRASCSAQWRCGVDSHWVCLGAPSAPSRGGGRVSRNRHRRNTSEPTPESAWGHRTFYRGGAPSRARAEGKHRPAPS
ncbi:hypothetical protein T440DRAFT_298236 [Plenodomus tracheiphilus IPT5]|uniref:Uncharacterized protein n=1 Tax=Plenodomus tracheiphilus IPT5 TaxID=1408161 RepID=A0A6A7ANX9_9PLEO|nr:hypothetical protein T440DRAFT_298236 [Plenodomus tracheiphilus IPT5]